MSSSRPGWFLPYIIAFAGKASKSPVHGGKGPPPTWFADETVAREAGDGTPNALEPMHGLRLIIREDATPCGNSQRLKPWNLEEVATRGLLASETWQCNKSHISLKTTIDAPLLGTVIEQNGDGLLNDSLMPVGWPMHLDGAVKRCLHRTATLQELTDLLGTYDMKRDLLELNTKAAQWTYGAVWNRWYMEPIPGQTMRQMWQDHETEIARNTTSSQAVTNDDLRRAATAAATKSAAQLPESRFLQALGTPNIRDAPPQTASLALRALEDWERCICENKAFAIIQQMQAGRSTLIKKNGSEMLIAMALDKPLAEAQALVDDPPKLAPICSQPRALSACLPAHRLDVLTQKS